MEEYQEGNFSKADEKWELGFSSPSPPPPTVDASDVEKLDLELQNLWLKEDNANSGEAISFPKDERKRRFFYPVRPGEPDCVFYLRTGSCRYGSNCKFNHPRRRRNQVGREKEKEKDKEKEEEAENENGKENETEEFHEKEGQQECKYYLKAGGCKFGKACRYNHSREQAGAGEHVDLNFLGLPMRPGERECPFYMRTGSCKFATNCRFHHPDPTAVGESDPLPVYQNGTSVELNASTASSPIPPTWSLQINSNEPVPYMEAAPPPYPPAIMVSPLRGVHPNPEWTRYMGMASPISPPEKHLQAPPASVMNDQTKKADSSTRQLHTIVEEFPERPGQSECQYFMKFGYCKFKSACRYHHPKNRVSKPTACVLSPMGLPLRPDQTICVFYSRYGICKFGPACKYDHPMTSGPLATPATPASDEHPSLDNSTSEEARVLAC